MCRWLKRRIPAAFNGLYGFRPSSHRLPCKQLAACIGLTADGGSVNSQQGQATNPSCLGPLSNSVAGLRILFQSMIEARPWELDPLALRMPYVECTRDRFCFALAYDDGRVIPHPPYRRALKTLKDTLLARGHKTIDWRLPDSQLGVELYLSMLTADGGSDIAGKCALSGEPILGGTVKGLPVSHLTTLEWWDLNRRLQEFLQTQLDAWNATASLTGTGRPIDGIIMPVAPYVSFKPGEREYIYYTVSCGAGRSLIIRPFATSATTPPPPFPSPKLNRSIYLFRERLFFLSRTGRFTFDVSI